MEKLKPCQCRNEYPTVRIVDCGEGTKLYQVYCKACKKSASVSVSREEAEMYWNRNMTMSKLKPCPFCNGKARVEYTGIHNFGGKYSVWCEKCKVNTDWYKNRQHAIEVWNRRANDECSLVDRL